MRDKLNILFSKITLVGAKVLLLSFINIFLFLYSLTTPVENGIIVTSLVVTTVIIYFMIQQNEVSEQRLRKLTDEIRQKNTELQQTNEQLDRFVYSASHNIKLPIITIKGLTHLAAIDTDDPKAQLYFSKIETQTDQMGRFLLEMLEYTRNTRTSIRKEPVNLNELVDEVIGNLSQLENASRIEFKKFVRIDDVVAVDRVRFMVILNNLLSNAIRHHNYTLSNPWVKIMISKVDGMIQVVVADNGMGINDEYKDKVFEMFSRASNSPLGSGLGLFIVKETVEKMNGKIMLSSTEGEGACFRIDVPLVA